MIIVSHQWGWISQWIERVADCFHIILYFSLFWKWFSFKLFALFTLAIRVCLALRSLYHHLLPRGRHISHTLFTRQLSPCHVTSTSSLFHKLFPLLCLAPNMSVGIIIAWHFSCRSLSQWGNSPLSTRRELPERMLRMREYVGMMWSSNSHTQTSLSPLFSSRILENSVYSLSTYSSFLLSLFSSLRF